jgi:aryl-alcohol dehydrogenase-like predicted oxidoreductase
VKLALGTAQFGLNYGISNQTGQVTHEEVKAILRHAKAIGITTLDTATGYGESEQRLGEIGATDWKIVTKLPAIPENCTDIYQWVNNAVNGSLHRLKVNNLYGLLLHRPQQLLEKDGDQLYSALQRLKQENIVKKMGVSIYDPSELDALSDHYKFDLVQAPFNAFDRRLIESGWMRKLSEQGVELHVRSIFLQGLLLMSKTNRPAKFDRWINLWNDWEDWLRVSKLSATEACVRYALSFPEISEVVVGVDSGQQLSEIIMASNGSMPELPSHISSDVIDLLNPACWHNIA